MKARSKGRVRKRSASGGTAPQDLLAAPRCLDARASELFVKGTRALHDGALGAAIRAFRSGLRRCPQALEAKNNFAVALCRRDRVDEAREHLEHCCREAPSNPTYHYNLAMVLTRSQDFDDAVVHLSKAIEHDDRLGAAYVRRAALHYTTGAIEASLSDFREAIRLGYDAAEHLVDAACVAEEAGLLEDARIWLERAAACAPKDHFVTYYLAQVLLRQGQKEQSLELLARLEEERPVFYEARVLRATVLASLRSEGDRFRGEAIAVLEALLADRRIRRKHKNELDAAYVLLGSLYDDLPEDYPRAIKAYRKGLAINPDHAIAHNNLGAIHLEQHDVGKALEHFRKALLLNPDYTKAYLNLARLYYHHRTEGQLQAELAKLIEEAPGTAARLLMGVTVHIADIAQREAYEDFYSRGHKLKNLLAVQGSRLHRLRRKTDDPDLARRISSLVESNEEMYDWILGYLKVIRPQPVRHAPVDLSALVGRTVDRLKAGLPEGIALRVDLARDCPPLKADADRLAEAVENLWTNALDAMEDRGGILTVATGVDRTRVEVWLSVGDTGHGIGPQMLQKIYRTGFTTKTMGSGLGLAIVRRVATDHAGMIEIASKPDAGTTFTLRFPLSAEIRAHRASIAMRPLLSVDTCSLIVDELA